MSTEYAVEPLSSSRFPEAATLLARAFQNDPVIASILPGILPEKRAHKLAVMFEEMLAVNSRWNEPLGIVDGGAVRAAAILHRPGTHPLPLGTEIGLLWRVVRRIGPRGLTRFIRWSLRIGRRHPTTPHYYLETLGVEPALQGRGLGSAMLRKIAAVLDAAGDECVLETANDRNVVLYGRFGFEITREEQILGAHVRFMRRRPVM
ncbi:MAG: GNAT family N-acetyltransferase [Planctomycetaceae bacterium]|nr:GNAT family N-acetyltransferase [Planctomycetaceae bacterium]